MSSIAVPASSNPMRPVLPNRGVAVVKSVVSGDTVVLLGKATKPGMRPPEVVFTFERVTAPRMASKANENKDDPGAFEAREWLRSTCIGKSLAFETRKQGATAGDRVYGLLFMPNPSGDGSQLNLAVEAVRRGYAIPKVFGTDDEESPPAESEEEDPIRDYERALQSAFQEAKTTKSGVHAPSPIVRTLKNSGEDFEVLSLVEKSQKYCSGGTVTCVIEYIFDGSRFRCIVTDPDMEAAGLRYAAFTFILAGIASPRVGNSRIDPPTISEPFAEEAKQFVELRLLHRELKMSLHGTDKAGVCAVGTVHHPRGNIGVELLKNGLVRMSDWSARMMNPLDLPAFRIAENSSKRTNTGVWKNYSPPQLSGASEISGIVVEALTGDTVSILPNGIAYDSEGCLKKVSLASVRSPRVGNERLGKADEPYAIECKDRLRVLTVGKPAKISIHYERDIPIGQSSEKRQFGTISVAKREDMGEILIAEGLATTQRHRDDDEKSPRYDSLVAAEALAKSSKKGVHSDAEYGKHAVNDLTDPRKAKSYSGALTRAGTVKAVVEHVFNGSRFKLLVPSENCNIIFALENLRCPQPTPVASSTKGPSKAAEPFGDASKRHARLSILQRTVEITCNSVTNGGVITGNMFVGAGGQRRDFCLEMVSAGLAVVEQRKIDYGEAPKILIDAQTQAQNNRVGLWSLEQRKEETKAVPLYKAKEEMVTIKISEIRSGNNFYFRVVDDESAKVIDDSMRLFTSNTGAKGTPCDVKPGKVIAALFDDGKGKSWYRAKVVESKAGKAKVLFIDHGNVAVVPISTHLRPLDMALGADRIPPVAKEAMLALTKVHGLDDDEGIDAARMLQRVGWGKELTARIFCESEGKLAVALYESDNSSSSINEQIIFDGLARAGKQLDVDNLANKMVNSNNLVKLAADVTVAQEAAKKSRAGMWRYGDIDEDEDE